MKPLRVLQVEDSPDDAELVARELGRGGYDVVSLRVQTAADMRRALRDEPWDLVVSDFAMPGFDALSALRVLQETALDLPFLIVSGTIGEETAVAALKAGAHDFVVKGRMARFVPAVERELREAAGRRVRRVAELALLESERKYRRIVETAQEGIWHIDTEGRTTYVNQRMVELLRAASAEALVGRSVDAFLDVEARAHVSGPEGAPQFGEFPIRREGGATFWGSVSVGALVDDAGARVGTLAMVTDVTDKRKIQAQLMVSDRMASVGMLAAGVAHEINNPLTVVMSNLEFAVANAAQAVARWPADVGLVELRAELADAREAAERVRLIVRDLKVFSRGEDEARAPVDVQRALDSAVRMAWNELRHRAVVVKAYQPVAPVLANESRLGQVFLNLLVNAAQAIPEGRVDEHEVAVGTSTAPDGRVCVEFRDTGVGMGADELKQLFTPFYTTKPVGVGTGLGLSICHRIVSAAGGEIEVESAIGRGSTFRLMLPAAPLGATVESAPTPAASVSAPRRGRLLVVDDEPMIGVVIRRAFEAAHEVVLTEHARAALELLARDEAFDAILCDLMMPDLTGMDLFERATAAAPHLAERFIFLSGGAFTPRARAFLDRVPNDRIEKPFDPLKLQALINRRVR